MPAPEADRRSGKVRELAEEFFHPLAAGVSIDDAGIILKATDVASVLVLDKCGSADFPYCVSVQSTRDGLSIVHPPTVFLQGDDERLDTIDCIDEGEVALKLDVDNSAIAFGDPLFVKTNAGTVDLYEPTTVTDSATTITRFIELGKIVGYAREKVAAGSGGFAAVDKVLAKLTIKNVPMIA